MARPFNNDTGLTAYQGLVSHDQTLSAQPLIN